MVGLGLGLATVCPTASMAGAAKLGVRVRGPLRSPATGLPSEAPCRSYGERVNLEFADEELWSSGAAHEPVAQRGHP